MIYLLCIFFPFLAVLMKGKPMQALLNFGLCFLFYIPAVIHAFAVVNKANEDKRHNEQLEMLKKIAENEAKKEAKGE